MVSIAGEQWTQLSSLGLDAALLRRQEEKVVQRSFIATVEYPL